MERTVKVIAEIANAAGEWMLQVVTFNSPEFEDANTEPYGLFLNGTFIDAFATESQAREHIAAQSEPKLKFVIDGFPVLRLTLAEASARFEVTGYFSLPGVRIELQGQPKFSGFIGPMWDNGPRYECSTSYAALSY